MPVRYLLNGATIVQEAADRVRYFHVELATHDILLAEGVPAESYLDTGNRGAFANGGTVTPWPHQISRCVCGRRRAARTVVQSAARCWREIRERLLAQAARMGHTLTTEPDVRLLVDGRHIAPTWAGETAIFWLPTGATRVSLHSRSFRPADVVADGVDHRLLGVAVVGVRLDGVNIALDDVRLGAGWHAPEGGLRWTDGNASIDCRGRVLEIKRAQLGRYWRFVPAAHIEAATDGDSYPVSRLARA